METADAARLQAVKIIEQHSKTNSKRWRFWGGLEDVLSFFDFPSEHTASSGHPTRSSTLTERSGSGPCRGIFPNAGAALRLISMVLIEQTEDWITERCYMSEASMQLVNSPKNAYTRGT